MSTWKHQGKWRYEFQYKGKRYGDSGYPTKREAKEAEAEHRKRVRKPRPKNVKFETLCDERLKELKIRCTDHHVDENEKLFEKLKTEPIDRKGIKRFLDRKAKTSATMANKWLKFIRAAFNWGIEEGLVDYNPTERLKPYPVTRAKKYIPPYDDIEKVLKIAKPADKDYLELLTLTLARRNEIHRLTWDKIFEDHLILMTRKSRNSDLVERIIPLIDPLKEVIHRIPKEGEFVFISPRTGTRYVDRKKLLIGLCEKAGVKRFTFHALRHYGASKLAQANVPLTDIQALLGHSRATTTDLYLQSLGFSSRFDSLSKLEFPA